MKSNMVRLWGMRALCASLVVCCASFAQAKFPAGYRDIKLGMTKAQVKDLMKGGPVQPSETAMGEEIGEIVRGDDLFRYATYRFNPEGVLVEIGLTMREVMGPDRVLEEFNVQYGLQLSMLKPRADSDNLSIEVKDNSLVMRILSDAKTKSAKGPQ